MEYLSASGLQIVLGFGLGALIAYLAWRAGSLSVSGGWAAMLTGGVIFGFGGLGWAVLLLLFFITSSALSRLFARRKSGLNEKFSKGSQRDWGQVAANGGLGAGLALLAWLLPAWQPWLWAAFAGAMAAVNGDTWATELGVLSRAAPRLITTGKVVERGTSGGVTLQGYAAVLGGSAVIGLAAAMFAQPGLRLVVLGVVILAGLAGSSFDSLLGATTQAIYWCPACQKETERHPKHTCGSATSLRRGWTWLDNDWVNFLCSAVGALVAGGLFFLM